MNYNKKIKSQKLNNIQSILLTHMILPVVTYCIWMCCGSGSPSWVENLIFDKFIMWILKRLFLFCYWNRLDRTNTKLINIQHSKRINFLYIKENSRIWETLNLSTDVDSSTDTMDGGGGRSKICVTDWGSSRLGQ